MSVPVYLPVLLPSLIYLVIGLSQAISRQKSIVRPILVFYESQVFISN